MKVLLVNPPQYNPKLPTLRDEICFQDVIYTPFPIRLAILGRMLAKYGQVEAIDANAEGLTWEELQKRLVPADAVIFQSAAGLIRHDLQVATIAKEKLGREVKTILIESVVSPIYPQRFLSDFPQLDFVIRGQPEAVIPGLIAHLDRPEKVKGIAYRKDDQVVCTPPQEPIPDLDQLPFMDYELFPMERYSISYLAAPMYEMVVPGIRMRTTRDCPYGCPFCIIGSSPWRGYDKEWRAMSPQRAVDEMEHVYRRYDLRAFYFWDETFTLDQARAEALCEEIIARGLKVVWRCLTRIDCVNRQLLQKMARAGCQQIEYGLEAGDPQIRKRLHKRFSDEEAIDAVKWTRQAGIKANCDLIVGMPWETRETLERTLDFAKRLRADNVHLTMAFPYPETEFYEIAEGEGLLEVDDIYELMVNERVRVGAKPVARSRSLRAGELEAGWKRVRHGINRHYLLHNVLLTPSAIPRYLSLCAGFGDLLQLSRRGLRSIWRAVIT